MLNKSHVVKNTISNYVVLSIKLFLAFFTTPIYLIVYGKPLYGLFILSTSLATSLTFLDFGAGKSLIKYTAEYIVNKDKKRFQSSLSTAISLNLVSLFVVLAVCCLIVFNVAHFFKIPLDEVYNAKLLFAIAIVSTFFTFLDFIPSNILQGAGIFHERNIYQFLLVAFNIALILWVYFFKPSIILFAWANAALYVLNYLIDFFLVRKNKLLEGISIKLIINKQLFKQSSFSYTKEIFLLSMVGFFSSQADKFIIGSVISVSAVAVYTVITRPFFLLKSFAGNIYSVLQTQIVKLNATGGDLNRLIVRVSVVIWGSYLFVLSNFVIFGQAFFQFWLKTTEYRQYFIWAVLAVFNWCLTGFFGFIYRTMFVTGETKKILAIDLYAAIINGVLSVLLTMWLGFEGVILGTTIQMIVLSFYIYNAGHQLYKIRIGQIFNPNLILFLCLLVLITLLQGYFSNWQYILSIKIMVPEFLFFTAAFIYFLRREKILNGIFRKVN